MDLILVFKYITKEALYQIQTGRNTAALFLLPKCHFHRTAVSAPPHLCVSSGILHRDIHTEQVCWWFSRQRAF